MPHAVPTSPELDNTLVDPATWADEERSHQLLSWLRQHDPVRKLEPEGFRPFWAVTKHADILEIERQQELFLNDPRCILGTTEAELQVKAMTGGSPHLVRSLVQMDNPDHRKYRMLTQSWFLPGNLRKLETTVQGLAKEYVDRMADLGGECDFVKDVAIWFPLRVIMSILGVPAEDEPRMMALTQELFGAQDPDTARGTTVEDIGAVVMDFMTYFNAITEDRRANPKDDVATVIANATVDGAPIGQMEAMSYYIIIATAGHDTTSSTTSGGMLELMRRPGQYSKLRGNPDGLMKSAVEEMIRWVTPVRHFMRTAAADYQLRGQSIAAGDDLILWYPSGNRDEEVFKDPFEFRVDRDNTRNVAFGYGAHVCLGQHLARMEIAAIHRELVNRVAHIEQAGEPSCMQSTFVGGLKSLPVRYTMK